MSRVILILCLLVSATAGAQTNILENTWAKDSRILFLGVDNELRLPEQMRILSASCKGASLVFSEDSSSIIVKPFIAGPLEIALATPDDTLSQSFISSKLPYPHVGIGDSAFHLSSLTKDRILESNAIRITGDGSAAAVFIDGAVVSGYEIQVDDRSFEVDGYVLSNEIREAILQAEPGSAVIIRKVLVKLQSGKKMKLGVARRYSLGDCTDATKATDVVAR